MELYPAEALPTSHPALLTLHHKISSNLELAALAFTERTQPGILQLPNNSLRENVFLKATGTPLIIFELLKPPVFLFLFF